MWLTITSVNLVLSVIEETHVGSCECQTVVWPRTNFLFSTAQSTRKSAPPSVNLPCVPSVASHFMLFSGVSCPKSALMMAPDWPEESKFLSDVVPK